MTPNLYCPVSGNGLLHTLTSSRNYRLRVDLEDFDGNTAYASYRRFAVGSAVDGFKLTVGGYSGTAGWCPQQHLVDRPLNMWSHLSHKVLLKASILSEGYPFTYSLQAAACGVTKQSFAFSRKHISYFFGVFFRLVTGQTKAKVENSALIPVIQCMQL